MDGIIFDVDGTIWNSTETAAKAWTAAIQERTKEGRVLDAALLRRLFGKTVPEIEAVIFEGLRLSAAEKRELMHRCTELENEYLLRTPGDVYDGVEEMLATLSKRYPLYIVSNCDAGYIETMLEGTGFGKYFSDHLCYADTNEPKGCNIRRMVKEHGLKAPVYVGDTQGDLDACREAGVPMIHVTYGFGTAEDPDYTASCPADVVRIVQAGDAGM